jgi:nitrogen fixation/metabolism regulation signal transduction histidine kinase
LVYCVSAALCIAVSAAFTLRLLAASLGDLATRSATDEGAREFTRLLARERTVSAASSALVFLAALGLVQVAAALISIRVATRGLDREFARMRETIQAQERVISEAAALSGWKEVASFLSHQLKNPLQAVDLATANSMKALDLYDSDDPGRADALTILRESLATSQSELERMKALINRLKSLTAFSEPRFGHAELGALCRIALERYSPSELLAEVSGDARCQIDGDLVTQALINILDNAREEALARDAAPARVSLFIQGSVDGARVSIRCPDTRLSPAEAGQLGARRYTTKRSGSGLGLVFVSRIMGLHGGSYSARVTDAGDLEQTLRFPAEGGAS